jgi:hypothetical protein
MCDCPHHVWRSHQQDARLTKILKGPFGNGSRFCDWMCLSHEVNLQRSTLALSNDEICLSSGGSRRGGQPLLFLSQRK